MPGYKLLLVSSIPVAPSPGAYHTIDLWARDLSAQLSVVDQVCVVSPQVSLVAGNSQLVPPAVRVLPLRELAELSKRKLREMLTGYDVVQVHGGKPSWRAHLEWRVIRAAREAGCVAVYAFSSDRVQTTVLNARGRSLFGRLKAWVTACSIDRTQRRQSRACDGLLLVGEGLAQKRSYGHLNIHVGTASWISTSDVLSQEGVNAKHAEMAADVLRLCVASRLEPMKGVHLAIRAMAQLQAWGVRAYLGILGEGPEEKPLRLLAASLGVDHCVRFLGSYPYGCPFYDALRPHHLLLMPNLNDEQPRVLFDALSQGVLPVCPKLPAYVGLGIEEHLLYMPGSAESIARTVKHLLAPNVRKAAYHAMRPLVLRHTIEAMHEQRAQWISRTIAARASRRRAQ